MPVVREPQRLSLEVRFDRQPIEGRLYAEEGALVRSFSGWIGLMAAIEAAGSQTDQHEDETRRLDEPRMAEP
jgi:hypothetical protein